jgi:hypothetical protein
MKKKLEYLKRKFFESDLDLNISSYHITNLVKIVVKSLGIYSLRFRLDGNSGEWGRAFTSQKDCIDYLMENYRIIILMIA